MNGLLSRLTERFNQLAARERVLVGSAAALIALALLWWVGIAPALATLREANASRAALDAQLQSMQALAAEAAGLKAQRSIGRDEALRALQAGTQQHFAGAAQLTNTDSRATLTLRGVSGDALAAWLSQTRINARLVPSEMKLTRSAARPAGNAATASATSATNSSAGTSWDGLIVLNLPER